MFSIKQLSLAVLCACGAGNLAAEEENYSVDAPAFDIATTPSGSIVVAHGAGVSEIKNGQVRFISDVPVLPGQSVNGLATQGNGNIFATTSSPDLALGAAVWRVTRDGASMAADIESFETVNDPDAFQGVMWKDQRCEFVPDLYSVGPQSNPYHLAAAANTLFVADAAGNTVLTANRAGDLDVVAVMTPPVDEFGEYEVLFSLDDGTDCYVQPVPTAVALDDEGNLYVGELTGAPSLPGTSRVWRIDAGARNTVCPSESCSLFASGMTSIIDMEMGPGGQLYVLEYDEAGWLSATSGGGMLGGTLNRCDVDTGACTVVADGLFFPGAIAFDKSGELWLLESNIIAPVVRNLEHDG